jgi:hypothetical protein
MRLYHVTPTRNLGRILREGLLPRKGPRSRNAKERVPAIYCFPDQTSLEEGISQWFFDLFTDETPLALLEITVAAGVRIESDVAWERHLLVPIPPDHLQVLDRNYGGYTRQNTESRCSRLPNSADE